MKKILHGLFLTILTPFIVIITLGLIICSPIVLVIMLINQVVTGENLMDKVNRTRF